MDEGAVKPKRHLPFFDANTVKMHACSPAGSPTTTDWSNLRSMMYMGS
jgi:hypothetical protein